MMTFQTLNGMCVTLDAPFEVSLMSHDRVLLNKGRARVRVPEGAEGFRLESPAFEEVDLGTEFAALVHADGTGTCRIFEGKADVSLLDSIGEVKRTQQLVASESVRTTPSSQAMDAIMETDDSYPEIKQPPRPKLDIPSSYAVDVMAMAPAGYWRFEALQDGKVPNEAPGEISLKAAATGSRDMVTLYLDGEVVAREHAGAMPLESRQIFVGRLNGNREQSRMESRGLVGHIDELAIFQRALTDHEIRRLANP